MKNAICLFYSKELKHDCVSEYRFLQTRRFRFDYCLPSIMVAIEIEGGVFTNGRHTRGVGFMNDMEKYNLATSMGWRIFRTVPGREASVVPLILELLKI